MQNIKVSPLVQMAEGTAADLMFTGFRRCDRSKSNRCIVTRNGAAKVEGGYETEMFIVTAELSLTQGEFVVTLYDANGQFVASARCDQFDR